MYSLLKLKQTSRYTSYMVEIRCVVSGKVQGVAYRAYVEVSANALGIVGFSRNLPDGTVEVVAQGDPTILKEFVEHLHEGSLLSLVEAVAVEWGSVQKAYDDFSTRHN